MEPGKNGLLLLGGELTQKCVEKYVQENLLKCSSLLKPIVESAVASNDTHVFVVGGWNREGYIQVYLTLLKILGQ